jgi:hypothetical protein
MRCSGSDGFVRRGESGDETHVQVQVSEIRDVVDQTVIYSTFYIMTDDYRPAPFSLNRSTAQQEPRPLTRLRSSLSLARTYQA